MDHQTETADARADQGGSVAVAEREPTTAPSETAVTGETVGDRRARRSSMLRFAGPIVLMVLGIKALLFVYGVWFNQTSIGRNFTDLADRMSIWNRWDTTNYLSLAEHGYETTGRAANYIVFFPGYPFSVRGLNPLIPGDTLTAAFVVAGIASVAAALCLGYLARVDSDGDDDQALRSVWFFLIFPTAYFLHIPYTESLFLTFVIGAFLAARTGRWATAGILGMFAALTRLNGVLLIPALAVEAFLQYRRTGTFDRRFLWIGAIAIGAFVYLGINEYTFNDPFHFQDVQKAVWYKSFEDPLTSVKNVYGGLAGHEKQGNRLMISAMELVFLAIGLIASIAAWFWTRPSYAVWAFLNVLLFASTSWVQSTPRYVLTLFPIFLLLAQLKSDGWASRLVTAASLLLFALFAGQFAVGNWGF
ncbi:MAG: mannosyltransferase family protein [Solirubrobacteraceae bacterium]|nr:mannosyltransferase family protein [Solirubrobacteraceae bacterium]